MDLTIRSFYKNRNVRPWYQRDQHGRSRKMIGLKTKLVKRYDDTKRFQFQKEEIQAVPMVTLRRKTHLFSFLVLLCQFAVIDSMNFLPLGIILYSVTINVTLELLSDDDKLLGFTEDLNHRQQEQQQEYEEEEFRRMLETAKFEYRILKNKPNAKFARVRDRDGKIKLFVV